MKKAQRHQGAASDGDGGDDGMSPPMTRDDVEGLLRVWVCERALPPSDPDELATVLIDALADHWSETPTALRDAVLAVVAVLRASD